MRVFYCDGSQHKELNKMGVGIVGRKMEMYHEIIEFEYDQMVYEVEAIIRTIEVAMSTGANKIRIYNDDRHLVKTIKRLSKGEKVKSKGLASKPRFCYLMRLVEEYNVKVAIPKTDLDKKNIKMCHNLSRSYLIAQ